MYVDMDRMKAFEVQCSGMSNSEFPPSGFEFEYLSRYSRRI